MVEIQDNLEPEDDGFCRQDILWAVGIWSTILTLSPVVLFYVLMVHSLQSNDIIPRAPICAHAE